MYSLKQIGIRVAEGVVLVAIGFGAGMLVKPDKVVHEKGETVTVVKWMTRTIYVERNKHTHKDTTTTKNPDGTTTTHTVEDTDSHGTSSSSTTSTENSTSVKTEKTVVTNAKPNWRIDAKTGYSLTGPLRLQPDIYGLELNRRVLGPIWGGVWGNVNAINTKQSTFGLSLSVEF